MSSDIFSRKIDIKNFDLIYAGAQKYGSLEQPYIYLIRQLATKSPSLQC